MLSCHFNSLLFNVIEWPLSFSLWYQEVQIAAANRSPLCNLILYVALVTMPIIKVSNAFHYQIPFHLLRTLQSCYYSGWKFSMQAVWFRLNSLKSFCRNNLRMKIREKYLVLPILNISSTFPQEALSPAYFEKKPNIWQGDHFYISDVPWTVLLKIHLNSTMF